MGRRRSEGAEEVVERLGLGEEVCDGGIDGTGEVQEGVYVFRETLTAVAVEGIGAWDLGVSLVDV